MTRSLRATALILSGLAGAAALSACTYVERERPPQQATVIVPQQQPAPTVVAPAAPPTVTVRPSY